MTAWFVEKDHIYRWQPSDDVAVFTGPNREERAYVRTHGVNLLRAPEAVASLGASRLLAALYHAFATSRDLLSVVSSRATPQPLPFPAALFLPSGRLPRIVYRTPVITKSSGPAVPGTSRSRTSMRSNQVRRGAWPRC